MDLVEDVYSTFTTAIRKHLENTGDSSDVDSHIRRRRVVMGNANGAALAKRTEESHAVTYRRKESAYGERKGQATYLFGLRSSLREITT